MKLSNGARTPNDRNNNHRNLSRRLLSPVGILLQCVIAISVVNLIVLVRPALAADPEIADFEGFEDIEDWTFSGQIINVGNAAGMVVTFGGILEGQSVTCNDPAGHFSHTASPGITSSGTVTASVSGSATEEFVVNLDP